MGQHATCPKCKFSFFGGHSHHTGDSSCVCLSCLTYFSCPTESEWGPQIGEEIQLCRVVTTGKRKKAKTKRVPTGFTFTASRGEPFQLGDETAYLVHYPIADVSCPECSEHTLSLGFEPGDHCPECKTGTLNVDSVIY